MVDLAPMVFSIAASILGILATGMLGMAIGKLNDMRVEQIRQGEQVLAHVTASHVHEAGLVRLEEQVKNVLRIAEVAHARADRIEADLRAKG